MYTYRRKVAVLNYNWLCDFLKNKYYKSPIMNDFKGWEIVYERNSFSKKFYILILDMKINMFSDYISFVSSYDS